MRLRRLPMLDNHSHAPEMFTIIKKVARNSSSILFAFQEHGGQFLMLDDSMDTALLTLSFNESYAAGNLSEDITKFANQLD
jgi:hypothetical protein